VLLDASCDSLACGALVLMLGGVNGCAAFPRAQTVL
jgi:hypothetical protein